MKRVLILWAAGLAALACAAAVGAATTTIQITKNGFTPGNATVDAGDVVTWHNADTKNHQVVATDGTFASPVLAAGASWSYTASKSGKFGYRDAFATTHKGTLTVKAPPATLSLQAAQATVIYGSATQLSGQVSNLQPNAAVSLTAQPYGKPVVSVAATTSQANGTFVFGVTPTIQTVYSAHYKTVGSGPVTVNVAPRVGLGLNGKLFVAKVTSDIGYGGHYVVVQKRNAVGGWYSFKKVYLGDTSRAVFRVALPKGRYVLRLVLPGGQAGTGYVQGVSRLLPIVRK